jgi:hypothetical protein
MTPTPEGAALIAHREAAAAELKLPVTDPLCIQYAALRAAHDLCQVKIAEGALDALADLIRLHDAMLEIKKLVPPEPLAVTLTIVKSHIGIVCPHCRAEIKASEMVEPQPPSARASAASTETLASDDGKPAASHSTPAPARMGVSDSAFHDQPGVPLKRYDEPWRVYGRTS